MLLCSFMLVAGRYVLMVSLYNRLGGHSMRWSKLRGQQWGGATLPLFHEGNFHNVEMKVKFLCNVIPKSFHNNIKLYLVKQASVCFVYIYELQIYFSIWG